MFFFYEKSGYDHITLNDYLQIFLGSICWFGICSHYSAFWMESLTFYSLNNRDAGYLLLQKLEHCNIAVIDDRCFVCPKNQKCDQVNQTAAFVLDTLSTLGYTLALDKCQVIPSIKVNYLWFLIDSDKQAHIKPEQKNVSFISLGENILDADVVDLKTLQRFARK